MTNCTAGDWTISFTCAAVWNIQSSQVVSEHVVVGSLQVYHPQGGGHGKPSNPPLMYHGAYFPPGIRRFGSSVDPYTIKLAKPPPLRGA